MWLRNIEMKDFRNYDRASVTPHNGLNVLRGPNGAGKTNLLEAIGILSHGRSLRLRQGVDLVRQGTRQCELRGTFLDERGVRTGMEFRLDLERGKHVRVNGKPVVRISDVFRLVPTVQCFEGDTHLLQGPPTVRRTFIDCLCAQLMPDYLRLHHDYREVLKQRNELLRRGNRDARVLQALDAVFVERAAAVSLSRSRALVLLDDVLAAQREDFVGEADVRLRDDAPAGGDDASGRAEHFRRQLARSRREEERFGRTMAGPHRDAFSFVIGETMVRGRASRGQVKNMILRLKMAEYRLLHEMLGRLPIVLLDDVFAEMDAGRRSNLSRLLDLGAQVFWASTGEVPMVLGRGRTVLMLDIEEGSIRSRREIEAAA